MSQLILPGTAGPGDVLTGKNFSAGTNYGAAGSMPNRGGIILTPGAVDQLIAAGYHDGTGKVVGDANLVAANIMSGKSIFGVAGNVTPKKYATGSVTSASSWSSWTMSNNNTATNFAATTVSGLTFQPLLIVISFVSMEGSVIYVSGGQFQSGYVSPILATYTTGEQAFQLVGNAYVNSTGFQLPCASQGQPGTWYAYA